MKEGKFHRFVDHVKQIVHHSPRKKDPSAKDAKDGGANSPAAHEEVKHQADKGSQPQGHPAPSQQQPSPALPQPATSHPNTDQSSNNASHQPKADGPQQVLPSAGEATGPSKESSEAFPLLFVNGSHLLIKHKDSYNPVSARTGQPAVISKEQATEELKKWAQDIKSGKFTFAEAAKQRSDCSTYEDGGDMGKFERAFVETSFGDAAFALKVGEMSGVVETSAGVHLILRTA